MSKQAAATRSDMARIQVALKLARRGHDLLEQKRKILMAELMGRIEDVREVQSGMRDLFTAGTSSVLDNAYVLARSLVPLLARLAEVETSVYRLAVQIRRTVRRVNALEKVFIPRCEAQIRSIASALDENEREDMTRIKLSSERDLGL